MSISNNNNSTNTEILIPGTDTRQYRHIVLPANGLQVLLVSDPLTDKAAACCDVSVGSMADPPTAQGLAHFLEHMLFMGTEKYPEENEYSAFLNEHGGYSNAYTAQENTVYYFDVNSAFLEKTLDLFASFFTCPLFAEASTMREINAVDSENSKNLQSDTWRKFQLFKSMARKDHPLNAFSTGNLETLGKVPESQGTNIRDMMIEFYKKHYSANLMRVGIYGGESLDELEKWAVEKFSNIPNKEIPRIVYPSDPFGEQELKKIVEIVPVRDLKSVDIFFPIPAVECHYRSKPTRYIAHLIGHESDGSILSALKEKLLANGLSSYNYESSSNFACFAVTVELSDQGVNQIDEIISCIFAYIGMLKASGPQDWIWQEMKDMSDMRFRFLDKVDPADYITKLANQLQTYAPEHVIAGSELLFEKDLEKTFEFLNYLTPENCVVFSSYKGFEGKTDLKEKWYGTDHSMKAMSSEQLKLWGDSLNGTNNNWKELIALPKPNPFVPTDFDLRPKCEVVSDIPSLICKDLSAPSAAQTEPAAQPAANGEASGETQEEEEGEEQEESVHGEEGGGQWDPLLAGKALQLFHKQDSSWNVPKLNVYLSLESCFATSTPWNAVMTDLFQGILKELMNEYSYYADCAGLYYGVQLAKGGLEIYFQGYGHKLPILVERAVFEINRLGHDSTACSQSLFQRIKEKQLRALKNVLFSQPYYHCILGGLLCLEDPRWSVGEKYAAMQGATLDGFVVFASQFLAQTKLDVLVNGNATSEEAIALGKKINQMMESKPLPYSHEFLRRAVSLFPNPNAQKAIEYVYHQSALSCNPNEVNSAIENIYFVGEGAGRVTKFTEDGDFELGLTAVEYQHRLEQESMLEVVLQLLKEAAFDQLRTKEQLGYIVFTSSKRFAQNMLSLSMIVQSSHKDPVYLDGRIEEFLTTYRQTIAELGEEKLQKFVDAVIEKLLEKPKNLDQESDKFWNEIRQNTYLFDRPQLMVDKLKSNFVTVQNVLHFYDKYLLSGSLHRSKFSSQFFGNKAQFPPVPTEPQANKRTIIVKDHSLFKRMMPLLSVQSYEV